MFLAKPLRFRADLVCARSLRERRRSSERRFFVPCWPCASSRPSSPAREPDVRIEPPCELPPQRSTAARFRRGALHGGRRHGNVRPRCALGSSATAGCSRNAFPGAWLWQVFAVVRSRAAIRGNFLASCIPEGAPQIMHRTQILPSSGDLCLSAARCPPLKDGNSASSASVVRGRASLSGEQSPRAVWDTESSNFLVCGILV